MSTGVETIRIAGGVESMLSSENTPKRTYKESESRESLLRIIRHYCSEANMKNCSPLNLAVTTGDVKGVQALLQCTYDMVKNESEDVRKFLTDTAQDRVNKAEPKFPNATPIHIASHKGHTEIVSLLIESGADIETLNTAEFTPLHVAALGKYIETISLLIAQKADIDKKGGWFQRTPLTIAAEKGNTKVVSLFISHGANIEAENKGLYAPLSFAAQKNRTETASLLLLHKANIETEDGYRQTPLHIAAYEGHQETVSLLITLKANIEAKNQNQSTPLHIAVENCRKATISLLISFKADLETEDEDGNTPLEIADNEAIKVILQNAKKEREWSH